MISRPLDSDPAVSRNHPIAQSPNHPIVSHPMPLDLVIRVVILFNFQLPVFKERRPTLAGERVHSISLFACRAQGGK